MKAMVLPRTAAMSEVAAPLLLVDMANPTPGPDELLVKISVCGVCHTELDEIEGRTPPPRFPVIPGHEVVGHVESTGSEVHGIQIGERVGVGWIHRSTGGPSENLSADFVATGRDTDGGYAEYMTVPARYAHRIPEAISDEQAAPLLCAGAIGYRALRLTGIAEDHALGLTGFGGCAHLVLQMVRHLYPTTRVHVFARDAASRAFARELGADWTGKIGERAPEPLHACIDTTPAWTPIVEALANLRPGGRLVVNAIRKQDDDKDALLRLSYHDHLWMEREIKSVANITGADIAQLLTLAGEIPLKPVVEVYPLEAANQALQDLRSKPVKGAKVLAIEPRGAAAGPNDAHARKGRGSTRRP